MAHKLLLMGLVASAVVAVACGGGEEPPPASVTPTASGRTPTGTALAAATGTPAPATPTPVPPTGTPPPPSPVALPALPEELSQYAATIARYLTATGAPPICPGELLDAWAIPISAFARCVAADTDADGQDELILVLTPPLGPPAEPGLLRDTPVTVVILDRLAGSWGVAFQSPSTAEGGGFLVLVPGGNLDEILMAVYNVNAVPGADVVYRVETCGAHTCFTTVEVYGWNGATYVDLTDGEIVISYADVSLEDMDGDGDMEIIMHGGAIGSVGAGPTRTRTEVYGWDGGQYVLAQVTDDASTYLYHSVLDADDALLSGDPALALELYGRALENPSLVEWKQNERAEMVPYLYFRLGLAYMALGGAAVEAGWSLDAAIERVPGSLHGEMARAFRDAWLPTTDTTAGCRAADNYVQANLDAFEEFWYFGYGNREFHPEQLCPL